MRAIPSREVLWTRSGGSGNLEHVYVTCTPCTLVSTWGKQEGKKDEKEGQEEGATGQKKQVTSEVM